MSNTHAKIRSSLDAYTVSMDRLDSKILSALAKDSRSSYREIARTVGASPTTVMNRVKAMEGSGIIRGYTLDIDHDKLGLDIHVIIDVRVAKGKLQQIEKKIAKDPNVQFVFDNTGPSDATVIARFRSRSYLDNFIKKLQTFDFVERTETKLILNTIKESAVLIT